MIMKKTTTINMKKEIYLNRFRHKTGMTRVNDLRLAERILAGEEKALRDFIRRFEKKIINFLKKRIENTSDCEEMTQDILLSVIEALRDYGGRANLNTFVFAITRNKVVDFYRKKKIKQVLFSLIPEIGQVKSTVRGPEEKMEEKDLKEQINKTLKKIKPIYRKVIMLKYYQGFSIKEIANNLSETVKMVESRLFRARKAFINKYE